MSKKTNPAVIGAFVLGAAVLAVATLLAFGQRNFLERKYTCVLYFDESTGGLDIGAPVDFMGIRIGSVTDIDLVVDMAAEDSFLRPVTISLDANRLTFSGAGDGRMDFNEWLDSLIRDHGLRAQLATQSLLTGKLKIQLGFHPETPKRKRGVPAPFLEIPTIPSTKETVVQTFEHIPVEEIVSDIRDTARAVRELADNPELTAILTNLNKTLVQLDTTLVEVDRFLKDSGTVLQGIAEETRPLLLRAADSMDTVESAMTNAASLLAVLESKSGPLLKSLTGTAEQLNMMIDAQSPIRMATQESLEDLKRTLRSVNSLADYLQRHPESLLRGKK